MSNLERLRTERCASAGNLIGINKMWKRKGEIMETDVSDEKGGVEAFERSMKMQRSPPGGGKSERIERLFREMRGLGRKM